MDIHRLEEFIIIAEEQSIRNASVRLNLAPATLSSRLSVFERDLNTQLFRREHGSLTLTDAGARLYHNASEILSHYHDILQQMKAVSTSSLHSLRIGIIGSELPFHLGPYLDIINQQNPDIHIDLLDDSAFRLPDSLLSGDVDLCLGPVPSTFDHEDIICQSVAPPHSGVLMPISHPLAQAETISIHQLEKETFILFPEERSPLLREFQMTNLRTSLHSFEVYNSDSAGSYIQYMVPIGKGLLITPFHDPVYLRNCIRRPLTDLPCSAPDSILYLRNPYQKELKPFISGFMKFMRDTNSDR